MAHLAVLTQLESLVIDFYDGGFEDDDDTGLMFQSLHCLRELNISSSIYPENLSKFIFTQCSRHLERIVFETLIDPKHIAHLLDGTWQNDSDEDEGQEEEEDNEDGAGEDENEDQESEYDKKLKAWLADVRREIQERKKSTPKKVRATPLKRIEVAFQREDCYDPTGDLFDENEWNEWFNAVTKIVDERRPAVHLERVEPRVSAFIVRADVAL